MRLIGVKVLNKLLPTFNYYRFKAISNELFLLTVDTGDWLLLDPDDWTKVKEQDIGDTGLLERLKDAYIYLDRCNIEVYLAKLTEQKSVFFAPPSLHIIVVTSKCNLRCIYCHAGHAQSDALNMSMDTATQTLMRIFETPTDSLTIEIQGGEPTLNFPIVEFIVEEGQKLAEKTEKSVNFCVVSNFTNTLTEDKIKFLISHKVSVATSLDGASSVHEYNRNQNYPDGFTVFANKVAEFKHVWQNIESEKMDLSAIMTASRLAFDHVHETVDTYLALGFNNLFIRPVTPLGRGENEDNALNYEIDDFILFWQKIVDYIVQLRMNGHQVSEYHLSLLLKKIFHHDNGYMDLRFPCGACFGQIVYNYDGEIYSCDEGRMLKNKDFCIGNIADTLTDSLNNPRTVEIFTASLAELYYCNACVYKPYCGVCPVLNHKQSGRMTCNVYNFRRCRMYRGMLDYIFEKFLSNQDYQIVFAQMVTEQF